MLALEPANMQSAVVLHPVRRRGTRGQILGNGSIDGDIGVYGMLDGARYSTLEGHWEPSTCACAVDTGGDIQVLTGGNDGMISRWRFGRSVDADTGAEERALAPSVAQTGGASSLASVWAGESSRPTHSNSNSASLAYDQDNWSDSSDDEASRGAD